MNIVATTGQEAYYDYKPVFLADDIHEEDLAPDEFKDKYVRVYERELNRQKGRIIQAKVQDINIVLESDIYTILKVDKHCYRVKNLGTGQILWFAHDSLKSYQAWSECDFHRAFQLSWIDPRKSIPKEGVLYEFYLEGDEKIMGYPNLQIGYFRSPKKDEAYGEGYLGTFEGVYGHHIWKQNKFEVSWYRKYKEGTIVSEKWIKLILDNLGGDIFYPKRRYSRQTQQK